MRCPGAAVLVDRQHIASVLRLLWAAVLALLAPACGELRARVLAPLWIGTLRPALAILSAFFAATHPGYKLPQPQQRQRGGGGPGQAGPQAGPDT